MYIIGIILMFILPYAAGNVCKGILRWKETNQIETYLIGFFLLFLLQGVVFVPCVFLGLAFVFAWTVLFAVYALLLGIGIAMAVYERLHKKADVETESIIRKQPWRKSDKFLFVMMLFIFLLLIVRMVLGIDLLRDDIVLETVNTTLMTGTMFEYHPLTGMLMDGGMIASKKLVTLPLLYAGVAQFTGIEAKTLLYLVLNILVLICSYYVTALLYAKVTTMTRSKLYTAWIIYGLLILAGDYHESILPFRLLYQGYEGSTICFAVILPYMLYVVISWYKKESESEKTTCIIKLMFLMKLALGAATSMVITGLGTGILFLFAATLIAAVCCLLKSIQEVRSCKES